MIDTMLIEARSDRGCVIPFYSRLAVVTVKVAFMFFLSQSPP